MILTVYVFNLVSTANIKGLQSYTIQVLNHPNGSGAAPFPQSLVAKISQCFLLKIWILMK